MKPIALSRISLLSFVILAFVSMSLLPAPQVPPGMVAIGGNDAVQRYMDKEQMNFSEWRLTQSLIRDQIGSAEADFLNPDTSAIIAVYGQVFWQTLKQNQFKSDRPIVGLNLDQIYSYMDHRLTLVYKSTGLNYKFDIPYIEDYKHFSPSKKSRKGGIKATHRAAKSKKIRGLFSNNNDLIMGYEGYHEVLSDGSTQPVHPDSIVFKSFRAVASPNN